MRSSILNSAWIILLMGIILLLGCSNHPQQEDAVASDQSSLANGSVNRTDAYSNVVEVTWGDSRTGFGSSCSGTLVGCHQVITAAHCVCDTESSDAGTQVRSAETCGSHIPVSVQFSFYSDPLRIGPIAGTAEVHPWYREEEDQRKNTISSRADIALITLSDAAPYLAKPAGMMLWPIINDGTDLTVVGYGARMGYAPRGTPIGTRTQCDPKRYWFDHLRRSGESTTIPFEFDRSLLPDVFETKKSKGDRDTALPLPGDSGGPALINGAILGVTSLSGCRAGALTFFSSGLEGVTLFTRLSAYDSEVTHKSYYDWIVGKLGETCDNGIDDDCNGQIDCADSACATQSPCCGGLDQRCCQGNSCTDASTVCSPVNNRCVAAEKNTVGMTLTVGEYHACAQRPTDRFGVGAPIGLANLVTEPQGLTSRCRLR